MGTPLIFLLGLALALVLLTVGRRRGRVAAMAVAACIGIIALAALFWVLNVFSAEQLVRGYVDEVAQAFGVSPLLSKMVAVALVLPAVAALGWMFSFDEGKRLLGRSMLAALAVLYFGGLWLAMREQKVTRNGEPLQCYVVDEHGVLWRDIRYLGIDPETGRPCEAVEARLIPTLERLDGLLRAGKAFEPVDPKGRFFSAIGEPVVWFRRDGAGDYEFFDAPGHHPGTGERLEPMTLAAAEDWRRREAEKVEIARREEERQRAEAEAREHEAELRRQEQARIERQQREAGEAERARQAELARQAEEAARLAEAQRREQERLARLRRLVMSGSMEDADGTLGVTVVPSRPDDPLDQSAAMRLSDRLADMATPPRRVLPALLSADFVKEGHFARVYAGDITPLREAEAFRRAARILLGEVATSCAANASVQGIASCRITLAYKVFGADAGMLDSGQIVETGPGFSIDKAVERGVDLMVQRSGARLLKATGGQ